MKRFHRPFFALLFSLLLIGSQQAALAHMIGHIGGAETVVKHDDSGHGAALTLSNVCTTCIAFAALDGPPSAPVVPLLTQDLGESFVVTSFTAIAVRTLLIRRARGPPRPTPA